MRHRPIVPLNKRERSEHDRAKRPIYAWQTDLADPRLVSFSALGPKIYRARRASDRCACGVLLRAHPAY